MYVHYFDKNNMDRIKFTIKKEKTKKKEKKIRGRKKTRKSWVKIVS